MLPSQADDKLLLGGVAVPGERSLVPIALWVS